MQTLTKKPTKREILIFHLMSKENATREDYKKYVIITYTKQGRFIVAIYTHNTIKPGYHYIFKTEEERQNFINKSKLNADRNEQAQKQYKEQAEKENNTIQSGSILVSSWGYEQTNVDFYIVTERKNDFITLHRIGSKRSYDNLGDRGKVIPDATVKEGEKFRKKLNTYGGCKISSFQYAKLWDGEPMYWSSYA